MVSFEISTYLGLQPLSRNNSARELSAFAESAMAVNRVVLQHMSLNLLEEHPGNEGGVSGGGDDDETGNDGAKFTPPNEADEEDVENKSPASTPPANPDSDSIDKILFPDVRKFSSPLGLSPPSESLLMQRRKLQSQSLHLICGGGGSRRPYITSPSCC